MIITNGIWRVCKNPECRHTQLVADYIDDYTCEVCGHQNIYKMPGIKIPLIILGIIGIIYLIITFC